MLQQNENDLSGLDDSTGNEEDTLSVGEDYKLSNKTKLFVF